MTKKRILWVTLTISTGLILHQTILHPSNWTYSDVNSNLYNDYNATLEMANRRKLLENVCNQMNDKFRPEYISLFQTKPKGRFSFFKNEGISYMMCNIQKCGSTSWSSFTHELKNEAIKKHLNLSMDFKIPSVDEPPWSEYGQTSINIIQVRHPLERLLSSWRYVFHRNDTYDWLMIDDEIAESFENLLLPGQENLSWPDFVQKVVIENKFRKISPDKQNPPAADEPDLWMKHHWAPYWLTCGVCRPELMPKYIFHMDTFKQDLEQFFDDAGIKGIEAKYPHLLG